LDIVTSETPEPAAVALPWSGGSDEIVSARDQALERLARSCGRRAYAIAFDLLGRGRAEDLLEPAAKDPRSSKQGSLLVNTKPPVEIVVDGIKRGATPLWLPLAPGHHTIDFVQGKERHAEEVEIAPGKETRLLRTFER
jgi:hypothetical protein